MAESTKRSWIGRERHRLELVNLAIDLICILRGAQWAVRSDVTVSARIDSGCPTLVIRKRGNWIEFEATYIDLLVIDLGIQTLGLCLLAKVISEKGLEKLKNGKAILCPDPKNGQYWARLEASLVESLAPQRARQVI